MKKLLIGFGVALAVVIGLAALALFILYPASPPPSTSEEIAGIDADGNGVWDYIDQYITTTYPGQTNEPLRVGLRQYARAIEGGLLHADQKEQSIQFAVASTRAIECLYHLRDDARSVSSTLEAIVLNTEARSRAYLMYNEQSAGQVFKMSPMTQWHSSCVAE